MKTRSFLFVVCATLVAFVTPAFSLILPPVTPRPVTGSIQFNGAVYLNSSAIATASGVRSWGASQVSASSGSLASVAVGTSPTLASPWYFNSGSLPQFCTVGGYTFSLTSSSVYYVTSQYMVVTVAGTVAGNNHTATAFTGTFQVNAPTFFGPSTYSMKLTPTPPPIVVGH